MTVICTSRCRCMIQTALLMSCLLLRTCLGSAATVCHMHKRRQLQVLPRIVATSFFPCCIAQHPYFETHCLCNSHTSVKSWQNMANLAMLCIRGWLKGWWAGRSAGQTGLSSRALAARHCAAAKRFHATKAGPAATSPGVQLWACILLLLLLNAINSCAVLSRELQTSNLAWALLCIAGSARYWWQLNT